MLFIRATVRIFSFGERLIVLFNSAFASINGTINLSPKENILTIALRNIYICMPHSSFIKKLKRKSVDRSPQGKSSQKTIRIVILGI